MKTTFAALLSFIGLMVAGSLAFPTDGVCAFMTVSDLNSDNPTDAHLDITEACPKGHVDWHYPKGNLMISVSLPKQKLFTFCIEESWATMIGGVTDVTDGRHEQLQLPTKDTPTCVKSVDGSVKLLLTSEDTQYYMTTFKYSIKV